MMLIEKEVCFAQAARKTAQKIVAEDPSLSNHPALAQRVANAGKELHGE